jgi:hypothetical protein
MMMPNGMAQGGGNGSAPPPAEDHNKLIDLSPKLSKSECYARNESSQFPMENLFIGDTRLGCKSDADEQIILHFAFQENVKVRIYHN